MGMEDLFELEAPVFAPRFRSVVACLRLFFRPAGFSSRGTARAAYSPPIFFHQQAMARPFHYRPFFVSYWLLPAHTK